MRDPSPPEVRRLAPGSGGDTHSPSCLVHPPPSPGSLCDAPGKDVWGLFCSRDGVNKPLISRDCPLGEETWGGSPAVTVLLASPPGQDELLGVSAGGGV